MERVRMQEAAVPKSDKESSVTKNDLWSDFQDKRGARLQETPEPLTREEEQIIKKMKIIHDVGKGVASQQT